MATTDGEQANGLQGSLEENGSVKRIDPEDAAGYFERLNYKLENLASIFSKKTLEGDDNRFVLPFIKVLKDSLECLALKHSTSKQDQIDFSLTINPSNCGFPTFKDFTYLRTDKQDAASTLRDQLPTRNDLIEKIRWGILGGKDIEHSQILLKRYRYFTKVSETELFPTTSPHISTPEFCGTEGDKRKYILDWFGLEAGNGLPTFYRMWFDHDLRYPPLHDSEERAGEKHAFLEYHLQQSRRGIDDLRTFVWRLNQQIDEINPKEIRKYTLGPYHDHLTTNPQELGQVFNGHEDTCSLKFTVEMVYSTDVTRKVLRSNWEKVKSAFTGRPVLKEVYSKVGLINYGMIVPFRIKQKLRNSDEKGNKCNIYGVTDDGGISGI